MPLEKSYLSLYAIYQRTQSESKSQRGVAFYPNFNSVCNLSKNTIWKQITTEDDQYFIPAALYAIYQRTQSESKSQLMLASFLLEKNLYAIYQRTQSESKSQLVCRICNVDLLCMQSIKEHNLKANHNQTAWPTWARQSVCNLSKNTIWKQITTGIPKPANYEVCMQSIKEHNLKANHNHHKELPNYRHSVCNLSKNTIWKQITTHPVKGHFQFYLYAIYQRTQSESKSQLLYRARYHRLFCMQSIKEHNLKANHNKDAFGKELPISVCNLSKNTIWKQITTATHAASKQWILYAIYQRTQSESKSQPWRFGFLASPFCMQSIKEHNLKANHNCKN